MRRCGGSATGGSTCSGRVAGAVRTCATPRSRTASTRAIPSRSASDEAEALWRDPALTQLGYPTGTDGVKHLVAEISEASGAQGAVCAFITKQPTTWYGYAKTARIVIR
jgi:hypothetical protein